jgi:hypothetical protein
LRLDEGYLPAIGIPLWSVELPQPSLIFPRGGADVDVVAGELLDPLGYLVPIKNHEVRLP